MSNFLGSWSITKELFDWIRDTLPDGKTILELGSGPGTVKLLEYYKVYSIEHSKRWLGLAKGGNYIYAPIKKYLEDFEYKREVDELGINYKGVELIERVLRLNLSNNLTKLSSLKL